MYEGRPCLILLAASLALPAGLTAQNALMQRTRDFGVSAGYIFEGSS